MSEIVIGLKVQGEEDVKHLTEGLEKLGLKAEVVSADKFGKLSRSSSALSKSIDGVVRSLDPAVAATARYEREVALLKRGLDIGKLSQERYNQLVTASRARYEEAAGGARNLNSSLAGLAAQYVSLTAITAAATAALAASLRAGMEAEENAARLAIAIRQKGDAAKITAEGLAALASQLQQTTRFEDDAIQKAEAILLRFDSIDGSNIERVTRLTLDFAEATGRDAASAATVLGKALEEPGESMRALKEVGATLPPQMEEIVRHLMETGRTAEAQAIIFERLESKVGSTGETMAAVGSGPVTQLKNDLGDLLEALATAGGDLSLTSNVRDLSTVLREGVRDADDYAKTMATVFPAALAIAAAAVQTAMGPFLPFLKLLKDLKNEATLAPSDGGLQRYISDASALELQIEQANERIVAASKELADLQNKKGLEEQAKQAAQLKAELDKAIASLEAFGNAPIEKFVVPMPSPSMMTASGQSVPAALADNYREYLDLLGQGETLETRINDLVNAGLITREQATAALNAQLDATVKMTDATDEIEAEWALFQQRVQENFIRGVQTALADFFVAVFEGGDDAMANFADALKDLLFQTLAEYLAQWIITQAEMLAASLDRIAKEKAAQQAANAACGGGGAGGMGGMGGMSAAGVYVVAAVAIAAMVKNILDRNKAKEWGTTSNVNVEAGAISASWEGKLDQTGPRIANGIAELLAAFQQATGSFITGIASAAVQIRNDKKWVEVFVNDVFVGAFKDIDKAIVAAAKEIFLNTDLSKELDPIVKQVIAGYEGNDPKQLAEAVTRVQGIMDALSGLTDVEIALRDLPAQSAALAGELRNLGVSMEDSQTVALQWRAQQMQNLRDQITGHQKTAAEEMAEKQRQAAMFNAELALMRAELEAKRAELVAKASIAQADTQLMVASISAEKTMLDAEGAILAERIKLDNLDLEARKAYTEAQASIVGASVDLLNEQVAALDAILANLPDAIDPKEIKLGRTGGGGGGGRASAGPSRADRRDTVNQTLGDLAAELLPALVAQSRDLTERFADLRAEMVALGMDTAQLDALEQAHRDRLREQAQQEVGQYTQSPYQQQLAEILRWGAEMREVYTELGLSLEEVEGAEKARLETLGQEALAALGDPAASAALEMQQLTQAIDFLREHAEELGLSAEDVGRAIQNAADSWGLSILDNLLQYVDDEETKAAVAQMRYEMEIAMLKAQFEILVAMGALAPEVEAAIRKLFGLLPAGPPVTGGGSGSTGGGMGGFGDPASGSIHQVGGRDDSLDKLRQSIDRLREFYEGLYQDETISPLSLADRYALAAQEYADTIAAAQTGDEEAIAALPDVAQQYLDLASQMFGTSTAAYQEIFGQVASDVEDLIGALEDADDWGDLRDRLTGFHFQFQSMTDLLDDIEANTSGGFGGGGTVGGGGGTEEAARFATAFRATATDRATVYRNVPGLPSNVVVVRPTASGGGTERGEIDALRREIDRLGSKLERSLDKLAKAQTSAADQRARAAGARR